MYEHCVDSGRGRATPFQYNRQHGYIADGRYNQQYAVEHDSEHTACVEAHLGGQLERLVVVVNDYIRPRREQTESRAAFLLHFA